jgi:glycosyltransferase involved in cell wall biosynthesis
MAYDVSVVIPTYNRLEVLTEVLQGLEFQHEAPPFEVIVVDDGSTDGTSHWLRNRSFGFPPPRPPSGTGIHHLALRISRSR